MMNSTSGRTVVCVLLLCFWTAIAPAWGFDVVLSSSAAGESSTFASSILVDDSTELNLAAAADAGQISSQLQAKGTGQNILASSLSAEGGRVSSEVKSDGSLSLSVATSSSPSSPSPSPSGTGPNHTPVGQTASLSQFVAGAGSLSLNLQGSSAGSAGNAGQEAAVAWGALSSSASLIAGDGQASASQSIEMAGLEGGVVGGAIGQENVIVGSSSFVGMGRMSADLSTQAGERASLTGEAEVDGIHLLGEGDVQAVAGQGESLAMGVAGLRLLDESRGVGSFDMSLVNVELDGDAAGSSSASNHGSNMAGETYSSAAAATSGGSYSSYLLTGYRWNTKDPKVQLYLNPTNTPSGLTSATSQSAIASAANTWDDAVAQNIFADGTTVIVDSNKAVDEPYNSNPVRDGCCVSGWKSLGGNTLGLNRWWSTTTKVDGYSSIIESDIWFNKDSQWTSDLATAQSTGKIDLQSVALHELGHTIGMGDIYSSEYGGDLPSSDARTQDFEQVMNLYEAPQRELGNGDRAGAGKLYGSAYEDWLNGDFNGDGRVDLIQFTGNNYLNLRISNGDGTFSLQTFSPGTGYSTSSGKWQAGDFNGDGKTDLQHLLGGDSINTWINKGGGTFEVKTFCPWTGYGTSLGKWEVGDVDGDGKEDLQHIWGGDYINTWISKGDGTYQMRSFQPWAGYGTSLGKWVVGDVNGDEKSDLQHIWGGDYINTWISKGDGTYQMRSFQPWAGYGTSLGTWQAGDIDGDGKADLEHIWGGDYINTWISKGDGTYQMKSYAPYSGYITTSGNWIASDISGDNKDDLEYIVSKDHIDSWNSKSDGTYLVTTYSPSSEYDTTAGKWLDGDVNGDGKGDLMHLAGGSSILVWMSNGDGTFNIIS